METLPEARLCEFRKFVLEEKIAVVDPSPTSRKSIVQFLFEQGASKDRVLGFNNFHDAYERLSEDPEVPSLLIADFRLGPKTSLELIQRLREKSTHYNNTIFVLVTADAKQTSVAEALEEEVKGYLLKPYNNDILQRTLVNAVYQVLYPTPYMTYLKNAREFLSQGDLENALDFIEEALSHSPRPSTACYYKAQVYIEKANQTEALQSYLKGLHYNEYHHKCLEGIANLYYAQSRYGEAYQALNTLNSKFPMTPDRLKRCIELAIQLEDYGRILNYYDVFIDIENRDEDLARAIGAGLYILGKSLIIAGEVSEALPVLRRAFIASRYSQDILGSILDLLLMHEQYQEAKTLLKAYYPESEKNEVFYNSFYVMVENSDKPDDIGIREAYKSIQEGMLDERICRYLVKKLVMNNKLDAAEDVIYTNAKRLPEDQINGLKTCYEYYKLKHKRPN